MPTPSSEQSLTTPDGVKLHVEHFAARGRAVGTLVFVHGFSAHIGNFRHVGRAFGDAGLRDHALRLPRARPFGWAARVREAFRRLRRRSRPGHRGDARGQPDATARARRPQQRCVDQPRVPAGGQRRGGPAHPPCRCGRAGDRGAVPRPADEGSGHQARAGRPAWLAVAHAGDEQRRQGGRRLAHAGGAGRVRCRSAGAPRCDFALVQRDAWPRRRA